jgi:glyoxylase-like metal-dependent hydrolase (beta-lactamase superfamily II)
MGSSSLSRTITTISGNGQKLDGGAMFGSAPRALWERWIAADTMNRIDLACRAMLVRDSRQTVLVEAGIGAFLDHEQRQRYGVTESHHVLLRSLSELGYSDADVDAVVLTHLHFDHAGGLLTAYEDGKPSHLLFPNARYVTGRRQWQRACNPHIRDRASYIPELLRLLESSGRLELVGDGGGSSTLGPEWRFHVSDGHTPGQLLPEIDMPAGPVVFAGDLVPGTAWVHLPITMGYDRYPEVLIDEKARLLGDLLSRSGRLVFTHDPAVAIGRLCIDEKGRYGVLDTSGDVTGLAC